MFNVGLFRLSVSNEQEFGAEPFQKQFMLP